MYLPPGFTPQPPAELDVAALPAASRWVLSRLNACVRGVVAAMEGYQFSDATQKLYAWWAMFRGLGLTVSGREGG